MSDSRQRLIEKGLGLINPMILENRKLKNDVLKYINKEIYHSQCGVAILYIDSRKFREFLEKHHLDPEEFLGKRELLITDSKVYFSENYYYTPDLLTLD